MQKPQLWTQAKLNPQQALKATLRELSLPALSLDIPDACRGKGDSVSCKSASMASFNSYLNYMLFKQYSHMMA